MRSTIRWARWLGFVIPWMAYAAPLLCVTIGERLNYRTGILNESYHYWLNDTPINRDNKLLPQIRYGNFLSADLFLNYAGFSTALKGLAHSTDRDAVAYRAIIRELYFDHDFGSAFQLTVGRKIVKWGTGYAFNPCGVVEPARQASDPSDRREQYQGRQIIALDAFWGDRSFSLVYANEARYDEKFRRGKHELASRFYALLHRVDLSMINYWKEGDKWKTGFTTAYTYGSHIEFHSELIAQLGTNKQYHQVLSDPNLPIVPSASPYRARYEHSEKIFAKLLLGAQYTLDSGISLMIEYFYKRDGLTYREWQRWRQFVLMQLDRMNMIPPDPLSFQNFYNALYTLDRSGTMRHYGFFRGYLPKTRTSVELLVFSNLTDGSSASIATFSYLFRSNFTGWIRGELYTGKRSSEFGTLFFRTGIFAGAKLSF